MQKLMYVLRLGLVTGLCLAIQPPASANPYGASLPAREVPVVATISNLEHRLLTPPSPRYRSARLRRKANPAAGFGRDYFRAHGLSSQRKPDSFGMRAQRWWARYRPL